jgi:shikimate dehydrogenase
MKKYLVIGNPIKHSSSPLIHNYWFKKYNLTEYTYEKKKIEEKDLKTIVDQIRNDELLGANITVPFKKKIIPYLDILDDVSNQTQSVNTLLKINNQVKGLNTDVQGFTSSLIKDWDIELNGKNIFIIGAGGVTSSIIFSLISSANKIYLTNRTKKKAEQLKNNYPDLIAQKIEVIEWGENSKVCDLVINTTSVGLKNNENLNLSFKEYENNKNVLFYDIIYNPKETNFLKDARLRGNKTMNGEMMFLNQAAFAFQKWTGFTPQIDNEVIKLLDK